jgi:hypothetical protein
MDSTAIEDLTDLLVSFQNNQLSIFIPHLSKQKLVVFEFKQTFGNSTLISPSPF